ncbi:DMT family transporter [Amphritea atlantica]|uniref:DMT family transporter n=1 Tax=Amphritea atlantica TaxID=355243 RepID=A0ABY5GTD2_9GAMM|nr:DMT family transporter [Amphritea atlantica]
MLPLQAGVNAQLARAGGNALWASGISFLVGTLTLLMVYSSLRLTWPSFDELKEAPLWAWSGGLMGAFFVTCMAFFAPRLGATTLLALVISGQILASLLLDHFGAVGFNVHEINLWRILGVILIGTGVLLVRKF